MAVRSIFVALCAAMLALTACSAPSSAPGAATATATPASEDIAGLVDIGDGRQMYIECTGEGEPTVVLVSGLDVAGDLHLHVTACCRDAPAWRGCAYSCRTGAVRTCIAGASG